MENINTIVAIYAAALSTAIAVVSFIRWWLEKNEVAVFLFRPDEHHISSAFGIVISNIGKKSVVIRALEFEIFESKSRSAQPLHSLFVDRRDFSSPSLKKVIPDVNKSHSVTYEPNVIAPGEEYLGAVMVPKIYKNGAHWAKVTAYLRNSKTKYVGWVGPLTGDSSNA